MPFSVEDKLSREAFTIRGHRDGGQTSCPGTAYYELIQDWPHYVGTLDSTDSTSPSGPLNSTDSTSPSGPLNSTDSTSPSAPVNSTDSTSPSAPVNSTDSKSLSGSGVINYSYSSILTATIA
ncbi:hypothetical protein LSAT2_028000 [Lamellibrachia satsuma]|nr:hypothetical protein LSAT2_028000 [Lamellibrachia satsuma]